MLLIIGHTSKLGSLFLRKHPNLHCYCFSRSKGLLFFSKGTLFPFQNIPNSLLDILKFVRPSTVLSFVGSCSTSFLSLQSNLLLLHEFSSSLDQYLLLSNSPLRFINIGSFGSSSPYEASFYESKLNFYEFFKYYESFVYSSMTSTHLNLSFVSILPSIVIFPGSAYLRKMFILMLFSPFALASSSFHLPLISSNKVSDLIKDIFSKPTDCNSLSCIYSRSYSFHYLHTSFIRYSFIYKLFSIIKIELPEFLYSPLASIFQALFASKLFLLSDRYSYNQ